MYCNSIILITYVCVNVFPSPSVLLTAIAKELSNSIYFKVSRYLEESMKKPRMYPRGAVRWMPTNAASADQLPTLTNDELHVKLIPKYHSCKHCSANIKKYIRSCT